MAENNKRVTNPGGRPRKMVRGAFKGVLKPFVHSKFSELNNTIIENDLSEQELKIYKEWRKWNKELINILDGRGYY